MRYLLSCLLSLVFFSAFSKVEVIDIDQQPYENIGRKVGILKDKDALMTLQQVMKLDRAGQFRPSTSEILNFGNTKSAFWIKVSYLAPVKDEAYLIADIPNIEQIDCYVLRKDGGVLRMHSGSLSPPEKGVTATNSYRFLLPDQRRSEGPQTLYIRIKSNNIMLLPLKLVNSDRLLEDSSKLQLESVYIGVILSLFLFNLFLFFSLGDKTYLYYSLYLFFLFAYVVLYLRGYSYLFGYQFRTWFNLYPHIFHSLSAISAILFSRKFLNLRVTAPSWLKVYNFAFALCLIELVISALGYKSLAASCAQNLGFIETAVLVVTGIVLWRKGLRAARYYIYAWAIMAATIFIFTLSLGNVLVTKDYSFHLLPIGSTVELLLLAFALGDRYRSLMVSERKAKDENFKMIRNHNENLERVVKERTIRLNESIAKLEASNEMKNKLFSIVAHDLRSPFNSLVSIFTLSDMDMLSLEELKELLNASRKNIDEIHHTLDNLLYWAASQMESSGSNFSVFDLKATVEGLLPVYEPLAAYKAIVLKVVTQEMGMVEADQNQVQLILRNLIDNAIKFTPRKGTIHLRLTKEGDQVRIGIQNPVIDPQVIDLEALRSTHSQISTPGTADERGIGLGLQLCHEFARMNGRKLEVKLEGNEIEFYFFLRSSS